MRPRTLALVALLVLAALVPATAAPATAGVDPIGTDSVEGDPIETGSIGADSVVAGSNETDSTRTGSDRGTDASARAEFRLRSTLLLTPDVPGEITVVLRFAVPDRVDSLRTTLAPEARVVSTSGFRTGSGPNEFEWDGETASPTVTYRAPANRTAGAGQFSPTARFRTARDTDRGSDAPAAEFASAPGEQYLFVDAGPWALVRTPSPSVHWRYSGDQFSLDRTTGVAGEGAIGERIAFLGPHEVHTRRANGQTFRLVVPEAAEPAERPAAVLDALAGASGTLRIGDRDQSVFLVAAPAGPGDPDWAVRGLQTGDADVWVRAGERLDTPDSPWLHEYVHTRQAFQPTRSSRWLVEGSADYYAALLALRQDRIDFGDFAADLARGERDPYADAVLAEPATWESGPRVGGQYVKGALVTGELDRRIRLATNGSATFASVLSRLNARGDPVTDGTVRATVADLAGDSTADATERYTRTDAVPEMWSRPAHEAAFGTPPARVTFTPPGTATVEGPSRNGTQHPPLALATGETLTLRTVAENAGGSPGEYRLTLRIDGEPVAERTGTLAPDERATLALSHTFPEPGTYTASVAGRTYRVQVREPATVSVESVEVNRTTVAPDGRIRVAAVVRNDAAVPAAGDLSVVVDHERVATTTVELAPNETTVVSVPVTLSEPGTRRVSVGDRDVSVTVERDAGAGTTVTTPGFGAVTAWVALGVLSLLSVLLWGRSAGD
ncbi:hypothetical protein [Halorarum halobium]|uniref:hypothetical protein n=1 Tax=Halorarum halobium TaxID=3075121 RepID=UPI0028B00BCD|nr:hypothetical protein [Halobaculum sp. XH14]